MRRFGTIALLFAALTLGGCAAGKLMQVYTAATTTTVEPGIVIAAANAFNAGKVVATGYLVYCKDHLTVAICSAGNRRVVIATVRKGTAARNRLEDSIATGQPADATVYNLLIAAVNGLQDPMGPVATYGAMPK